MRFGMMAEFLNDVLKVKKNRFGGHMNAVIFRKRAIR